MHDRHCTQVRSTQSNRKKGRTNQPLHRDTMLGQAHVRDYSKPQFHPVMANPVPRLSEARVTCSHLGPLYSRDQKSQ